MADYQNEMARQQADYAMQQQAWGVPWGLTGMTSQLTPTGFASQQGGLNLAGGLMGGAMMGLGGAAAGVGAPWMYPLVGAGALGGLFGGK